MRPASAKRLWLGFIFLSLVVAACGDNTSSRTGAVIGAIGGVAEQSRALPAQDEIFVFDQLLRSIRAVNDTGTLFGRAVTPPAPPFGWPTTPPVLWRTARDRIEATVVTGATEFYRIVLDTEAETFSAWEPLPEAIGTVLWAGELAPRTTAAVRTTNATWPLPHDLGGLPRELSSAGFAYRTVTGAVAWWDPVSAQTSWRAPQAEGQLIDVHAQTAVWNAAGRLWWAPVSASAPGAATSVPLRAVPVELRLDDEDATIVWVAYADGNLVRYRRREDGRLCLLDVSELGETAGRVRFADLGALSTPRLQITRLGVPGCPGWVIDDDWTVQFGRSPREWRRLLAEPGAPVALPALSDAVRIDDRWVAEDGTERAVAATAPVRLSPPVTAPERGRIVPRDRWIVVSARFGTVAVVERQAQVTRPEIALELTPGSDPATIGDEFFWNVRSGFGGVRVGSTISGWQRVGAENVAVFDGRAGAVEFFNLAVSETVNVLQ